MTPAQRRKGIQKPPPHGTLDEQNKWYAARAHERWMNKLVQSSPKLKTKEKTK